MKIEVLFPEICNLYGDLFNVKYLKECLPDAEIINTGLNDEPTFLKEEVSLVYMGTTTERGQQLIIKKLSQYIDEIKEAMERGVAFLITGNGMEAFCNAIYEEDEKVCDGLAILDFQAKRKARKRFNSLYLGEFDTGEKTLDIVGFKSLFGYVYGDNEKNALFKTKRGVGLNPQTVGEGIREGNFLATQITGPLLVLNPTFTEWLGKEVMKVENFTLAHRDAIIDAYEERVKEYSDPTTGIYY